MTTAITRTDMTAAALRKASRSIRDTNAARRMLAIALVLEGTNRQTAAHACGMDRQSLRDWIIRYNGEGLAGLSNRDGQGDKWKLDKAQQLRLAELVRTGPDPARDGVVRWRRRDLARRMEKEFGVVLHERTVGDYLAAPGFRRLSVRPKHPKADEEAQEAFKKNFADRVAGVLPPRGQGQAAGNLFPA